MSTTLKFQVQNIGRINNFGAVGPDERFTVSLNQVTPSDATGPLVNGGSTLTLTLSEADAKRYFPGQVYTLGLTLDGVTASATPSPSSTA